MKCDAIFFDIGNTLFFYDYDFLRGLILSRFDIEIDGALLAETHRRAQLEVVAEGFVTLTHGEIWEKTHRRWLSLAGVEEARQGPIIDSIRSHPFRHLFWTRMEEGTREMLDWFRERGVKLGVISNAEGQIMRILEHVGIDSRFDVVADSGIIGMAKPDAGIFRYALDSIGAAPERSLHVGDIYEIDVVGARNAGITPILVDREGIHRREGILTVARASDLPRLPMFAGL